MPKIDYRQCELRRGTNVLVTWLPSNFAKVGEVVKLKDVETWTDGWQVTQVWGTLDEPIHVPKAIRDHRHRTEDDAPKHPH